MRGLNVDFSDPLSPQSLFVFCIAIASLIALINWRVGIACAIVIGVIQDPVRKIIPGTPGLFAVSSTPVWGAAFLSAFVAHRPIMARAMKAYPRVARYTFLFCLALIPAATTTLRSRGSAALTLLGLFNYLAPIVAAMVGLYYFRTGRDMKRLLVYYCSFSCLILSGTIAQFAGIWPDSNLLGTGVFGADWIRSGFGIGLTSGFFRSPEIMSWHAAMTVMFALTLVLSSRQGRTLALSAASLGAVCLLLGGRRKMIAMPMVWAWIQILVAGSSGAARRAAVLFVVIGLVGAVFFVAAGQIEVQAAYYRYASTTATSAPDRLGRIAGHVLGNTADAGLLGQGVGRIATGARYLNIDRRRHEWAEGQEHHAREDGLSRIGIETGLLGLVLAMLLALAVAQSLNAQEAARSPAYIASVRSGMTGCVAACFASYAISHHAYGDVTVMCLAGLFAGIALSGRHWQHRALYYAQAQRKRGTVGGE